MLGEYNQLKKISQKFRVRVKADTKETTHSENANKRGASVATQKNSNQNKNVDRKIYKRICFSMLKALKTKVDEVFSNIVSPNDQNVNKYSKQPFLTIAPNDELPELLRETFEFYNKSNKKELKKTTTQAEKDILYECVFKMRYIYGGMIYHRYLSLNRQYYAEAAEECNEWFKQLKQDHEATKKEQIMNSESSKKDSKQNKE